MTNSAIGPRVAKPLVIRQKRRLDPALPAKAQRGAIVAKLGAQAAPPRQSGQGLGQPLGITEIADMLGCSPWTVRQTLIPQGLPHFRFSASGKIVFFTEQVIRWVEQQQKGGT